MTTLLKTLNQKKPDLQFCTTDTVVEVKETTLVFDDVLPRTIESVYHNRKRITGKRTNGSKERAPYKVKDLETIAESLGIPNFTGKKSDKAKKILDFIEEHCVFS